MKNLTMRAGFLAVVIALLVGSPSWADEKDTGEDLRRDVLRLQQELARLKKDIELDRRAADLTNRMILDRLEEMGRDLKRLNDGRVVRSTSEFGRDTRRMTGTIRFRNNRTSSAIITIDGIEYRVDPFTTRTLRNQDVGPVNYDVFVDGYVLRRATRLYADDPVTIDIR